MSVHKAITKHVNDQNKRITEYIQLEHDRERYIEIAVQNCQDGTNFSVEEINGVTAKMNELAKLGGVPPRKLVTFEMVEEYAAKLKNI